QDSSVHTQLIEVIAEQTSLLPKNYKDLSDEEKIAALLKINKKVEPSSIKNELYRDTLETIAAIKSIQQINGEQSCHRYIISHSNSDINVMEVYVLFLVSGWKPRDLSIDIVPLFETIDDMRHAGDVMKALYENKDYRKHLE